MKNLISKYGNIIIWLLPLTFLLILPAVWSDKKMLDASLLSRQLALSIILIYMVLVMIAMFRNGYRIRFAGYEKIIFGGLALFMLMHIVSAINVINPNEALFRTSKEFMFCLWFFSIYTLLTEKPEGRKMMIGGIVAMSAAFIAIGLWQIQQSDFSQYNAATRNRSYYLSLIMNHVDSTCSNKNLFASILFITLPFALYGITAWFKKRSVLNMVISVIAVVVIALNLILVAALLSRTVFAALALEAVVIITMIYFYILIIRPRHTGNKPSASSKIIMAAIPLAALLIIGGISLLTETQIEKTIKERILLTFTPEKYGYMDNEHGESSLAMRKIIWGKTIKLIDEHPLIGSGSGQWQLNIAKFGVDEFNEKLREGTLTFQRPHNDYLWFASEVGIIGLLGYLIFFIGTIAVGVRNICNSRNSNTVIFSILAIAALIGWMIVSALDYPHERIEHNVVYLTIAAIVLADAKREQSKPAPEASKSANADISLDDTNAKSAKIKISTIAMLSVCAIITTLGIIETSAYVKGEINGRKILEAHYKLDWRQVLRLTRDMNSQEYTINNYSVPMPYYRGFALSMLHNNKQAIIEFDHALELNPYHILTLCAAGTTCVLNNDYMHSLDYYGKVLELSPRNIDALYNSAIANYNMQKFETAFQFLAKIPYNLKQKPTNYDNTSVSICKFAVLQYKDYLNQENLIKWVQDNKRIAASLQAFQRVHRTTTLKDFMIDELGGK